MPIKFKSEQALAEVVINQLEYHGYEIWQEVQVSRGGPVADVVAQKDDELIIVECKRSFGYRLISDCMNWIGYADRIAMAYPARLRGDKNTDRAATFMINLYEFEQWKVYKGGIGGFVNKKIQKRATLKDLITNVLRDEHKQWAKAGSQNARRVSEFQITVMHLEKFVHLNPGVTLKEAVPKIAHHYASEDSAYSSLGSEIAAGHTRTVVGEGSGRYMKLNIDKEEASDA